jgi:ribosomal protein L11 methyltransferase
MIDIGECEMGGGQRSLMRLRVVVADSLAAREATERLSGLGSIGDEAAPPLATASFEDADRGCWILDAYYDENPPLDAVFLLLADLIVPSSTIPDPVVVETVPDENWVAVSQAALPPIAAGRFLVHGSHDRTIIGRRHHAIEIDAGEAFGTAHHATTRGCLAALDVVARRRTPHRILDLGCGSGVLAIAASRIWPRATVTASDLDPVAIDVARENVAFNGAQVRIGLVVASGLGHVKLRQLQPFDLVLANILAGPLIRLAPGMARAIAGGGMAVLSGILGEQAREVIGVYRMAGFHVLHRRVDHNWATLVLERDPEHHA